MTLMEEARAMLDEIDELVNEDSRRLLLILYARAMADALQKGDPLRIAKGMRIVRPVLDATRELDLIG